MNLRRRGLLVTSTVAALALGLSACGGGGSGEGDGEPQRGGTLRYVGGEGVDHVDTASSYYVVAHKLHRAFTRQLFSYAAKKDPSKSVNPVPDIATKLPTEANGGITEDGTKYTIKLRKGVKWNTNPPREVTAQDFVRGIKRLCNPAQGSGAIKYYTSTIKGMKEYCEGFLEVEPKREPMTEYLTSHDVEGLVAKGKKTIVFKLVQPAIDFLNILSMSFSSAAPKEYLQYIPDSNEFRENTISNGPYKISKYTPNKEFVLTRNKAWDPKTDPLRKAYVDKIHVRLGQQSEDAVLQQMETGKADLSWDLPVPTAALPRLVKSEDPNFQAVPMYTTNPYLVFNHVEGPTTKLNVRKAIIYAINKKAISKIYGGPRMNTTINQVIPPGNIGHKKFDMYPTKGDRGSPAKCKQYLKKAGYKPGELTIKASYRNEGHHPDVAQSYKADLEKCGINVKLIKIQQDDYYSTHLGDPANAKAGKWHVSAPGWIPDWYGNNGRTIVQPLFQTNCNIGTVNYGCYSNEKVDSLIQKALSAKNKKAAAKVWHKIDRTLMKDAAMVPFKTENFPIYHSDRVHNARFLRGLQGYDPTNIWIEQ